MMNSQLYLSDEIKQKAYHFIKNAIAANVWKDGERLPKVIDLARQSRVSNQAVTWVTGKLKEEGLIWGGRRTGFFVGHKDAEPLKESVRSSKSDKLRTQIQKDIVDGIFFPGKPHVNLVDLQKHYEASYPTIKKVIDVLMRDNILVQAAHGYKASSAPAPRPAQQPSEGVAIPQVATPTTLSEIILVARISPSELAIDLRDTTLSQFANELYSQALASNTTLSYLPYSVERKRYFFAQASSISGRNCGIIVWLDGIDPALRDELVRVLASTRKPLSIFTWDTDYSIPQDILNRESIRVITPAHQLSSRAIARHLISQGHQRFLYILHQDQATGSSVNAHYDSLSQALRDSGCQLPPVKVAVGMEEHLFTDRSQWEMAAPPNIYCKGNELMILEAPDTQTRIQSRFNGVFNRFLDITAQYTQAKESMPAFCREQFEPAGTVLAANLEFLKISAQFDSAWDILTSYNRSTAWVFADSTLAAAASHSWFAKTGQRKLPAAVATYDNDPIAQKYSFTSYDMSITRCARYAVSFLNNPTDARFSGRETVECEGYLVDRKSSKNEKQADD